MNAITQATPKSDAQSPTPPPTGDQAARTRGTRSISRAIWLLVLVAVAYTLHVAASLLLPILLAAMLSLLLAPAVAGLARLRIAQPVGAAVVVFGVLALAGALATNLYEPAQRWLDTAPEALRKLESRLQVLKRPVQAVKEASERVAAITAVDEPRKPRPVAVEGRSLADFLSVTQGTVVTVLTTVLLVYFLLASGDLFLRKLVRVLPRMRDKIRAVEIAHEIQREIGRYFATVTLANIGLGTATGVAMWLLGMPTPLLWGVAVAALNFLPYIGPLIAVVLLAAVALITFDSALEILAPPAAFVALNFVEDQLVLPYVLGQRLSVSPVVIFLWVLVWTWMWGVTGVLLAVPLLVAVRICAERVPSLAPLAEVIARD